ncbi:MAG: HNH endonuclease family protein, partial [Candidatus Kapaibacterium sp.]
RLSDEGEDVEKIYLDYWKLYETEFWEEEVRSGPLRRPRAVVFFNHWLFSMLGEDVSSGEVFAEFKRFLIDQPELGTLELVKRIHRSAELYADITRQAQITEGEVDRVGLFVYRAEVMQSDVVKTLLLALLDPDRKSVIPRPTINDIIEDVESWLVRRMLCREHAKGYNKLMGELVTIVRREPVETLHAAVRDFLARQRGDSAYWPDDAMVRRSVSRLPVYKRLSRVRVRMILEAIEDNLRGYGQVKGGLTGVRTPRGIFTIEHLMPQAWEANWPPPKDGDAARRNELLHTIGNLTLVTQALNSKVSNGAWEAKSAELNKHGVVLMNTRLHEYGATPWTDESIENRTQACIDAILDLWRVPEGHEIQTVEDEESSETMISIQDIVASGILKAGTELVSTAKGYEDVRAVITQEGQILCQG